MSKQDLPPAPQHPTSSDFSNTSPPPDLTPYIVETDRHYVAGGAFGDIYRCQYVHGSTSQQVAVKALRFKFTLDGDTLDKSIKMVRRELGIWKRLRHNNVVPFLGIAYGFGMSGTMSLVSLWMPNDTLHKFLARHDDKLDTAHRLRTLLDIAQGLDYLHSFPVVHGDLSSHNVLLDADYTARLVDFGYASCVGNIPEALAYLQRSTVQPGALRWIAPEQLESEGTFNRTTKSDIYSFGCLALQVLSGKQPWSEIHENTCIIARLLQGCKPRRPESRPIDNSHWDLIQRCWSPLQERPSAEIIIPSIQQFLCDYPQSGPLRDLFIPLASQVQDSLVGLSPSLATARPPSLLGTTTSPLSPPIFDSTVSTTNFSVLRPAHTIQNDGTDGPMTTPAVGSLNTNTLGVLRAEISSTSFPTPSADDFTMTGLTNLPTAIMLSHIEKRQILHGMPVLLPSGCCLPLTSPDPSSIPVPQPLLIKKRNRIKRSTVTSIHRCFLISEILFLILEFVRQFAESSESDTKWDRNVGKRTLASFARTCRTLSDPALDVLWMRLDHLDPLIKVLPRRMWSKRHYPFVVRLFMGEKQWATFRKYAERVRYLRGPCSRVSATVQHNVIDALVRYPKASLPLLPNLNELVWSELKMPNLIDPSVSLIRYFAGPRVTSLSLSLICWPNHVSSELAVLADLPNLCPNVTSFTAFFPRTSYNDHSIEIGEIVRQWPRLHILRSCALSQPIMDTVTSRQTLNTLSIELNNSDTALYVGELPLYIHTWSLGGNNAALCHRYLTTIQGSPTNFYLRIGAEDSTTADMEALVGMLRTRLDEDRLRTLTIELTSSYWFTPPSDSFSLLPILSSLACFSGLKALDVSTYCAAEVDDRGYEGWIAGLSGLTSLKVGVADVSKARPLASVGAVLAVLRACRQLETLWIVFDASLPLPPRTDNKGKRPVGPEIKDEGDRNDSENENEWGVTNYLITHLRVGYSPIKEDEKELEALARCFRTVMPRLEKIRAGEHPSDVDERWGMIQDMLVRR